MIEKMKGLPEDVQYALKVLFRSELYEPEANDLLEHINHQQAIIDRLCIAYAKEMISE
tara:strand:- start:160 stop:333 length:174 start_codon:yes stop_codon:yes gene_type:complete